MVASSGTGAATAGLAIAVASVAAAGFMLMSEAAESKDERAVGVAPETDYELTVKVKKYSKTWFIEVKAQAVYADGTSVGY